MDRTTTTTTTTVNSAAEPKPDTPTMTGWKLLTVFILLVALAGLGVAIYASYRKLGSTSTDTGTATPGGGGGNGPDFGDEEVKAQSFSGQRLELTAGGDSSVHLGPTGFVNPNSGVVAGKASYGPAAYHIHTHEVLNGGTLPISENLGAPSPSVTLDLPPNMFKNVGDEVVTTFVLDSVATSGIEITLLALAGENGAAPNTNLLSGTPTYMPPLISINDNGGGANRHAPYMTIRNRLVAANSIETTFRFTWASSTPTSIAYTVTSLSTENSLTFQYGLARQSGGSEPNFLRAETWFYPAAAQVTTLS